MPETRSGLADSPDRYGLLSRIFHWALAALIGWQLLGMVLKLILGRHPVVAVFVGQHQPLGALIFVLVVLRLVWALANARRRPPHEPGVAGLLARAAHGTLYLLMLAVPALALLRAWGGTRGLNVWGWQVFAPRETAVDWAASPAVAHGPLGFLLLALILLHVAAALWHRLVLRDAVLSRMAG
ncbi:cytochrome b [Oceanicola sp. S124]|uniref:cytochrome b n=1 Tax=Oceanicola sp. S124 TaxID=1042378 RepID=UPI0002557DC0|nr:cytochrome b/b6 domain-containing protein [Oceanicola sp. S124]